MPWLYKEPKKRKRPKRHSCQKPVIWPWIRVNSRWQCPDCGWIWIVFRSHQWDMKTWKMYDTRGFGQKEIERAKVMGRKLSGTLPPLHGGYRPYSSGPSTPVRRSSDYPKPPGGRGGGSK